MFDQPVRVEINGAVLELAQGDITQQRVDAIVNAANEWLAGGSGVDGAIHARGGPSIMQETHERYPEGCPTSSAVITGAGNLPAKFVIHAVGPIYQDGTYGEAEKLAGAFRTSLELATAHGCDSIALPAISAGAYGYPPDEASEIALRVAIEYLQTHGRPKLVRFVLFGPITYAAFRANLERLTSS